MKKGRGAWIAIVVLLLLIVATTSQIRFVQGEEAAAGSDGGDLLLQLVPILAGISKAPGPPPPVLDPILQNTSASSISISGQAGASLTIRIYANNSIQSTVNSGSNERFSVVVNLASGSNSIYATASNTNQTSSRSNTLTINRNSNNTSPIAFVIYGPDSGEAPLSVNFDGTQSSDSDGNISSYSWSFGDGGSSNSATTPHTYSAAGSYTASLTVTDNDGGQSVSPVPVTVTPATVPPVSILKYSMNDPLARAAPLEISFDGTDSYDTDGTIVQYSWDFGDGDTANDPTIDHTYTNPGSYTVVLTVLDNSLRSATSITQVVILEPVSASFNASTVSGEAPLFVSFDGSLSGGYISTYTWDFGDGTIRQLDAGEPGAVSQNKLYSLPGSYAAKLTVRDIFGKESSLQRNINVIPDNTQNNVAFSAILTSSEAPFLVDFSVIEAPEDSGLSYTIEFGDGSSDTGMQPGHEYAEPGIYTVIVTARNGGSVVKKTGIRLFVGSEIGNIGVPPELYPTWIPSSQDKSYFLTTGNLIIEEGGRMTIHSGVTIRAQDHYIYSKGKLTLEGRPGEEIVFTSSVTSAQAGDWGGLLIGSSGELEANHVEIEYATTGLSAGFSTPPLVISNFQFLNNLRGLSSGGAALTLTSSSFTDTTYVPVQTRSSQFLISDNTITGGTDCAVLGGNGIFERNTINSCSQSGIRITGDTIVRNNLITGIDAFTDISGPLELAQIENITYHGPSSGIVIDVYGKSISIEGNTIQDNHVGIMYFSNVLLPYNITLNTRGKYSPYSPAGETELLWNPVIGGDNLITGNEYGVLLKYPQYRLKYSSRQVTSGLLYPKLVIQPAINNNSIHSNNQHNFYMTGKFGFPSSPVAIDASENWWGTVDINDIYDSFTIEREGFYSFNSQAQPERLLNISSFLDGPGPGGLPVYPGNYLFGDLDSSSMTADGDYNVIAPIIADQPAITIPAGVTINFLGNNARFEVESELIIAGTESNPVTLTSLHDSPAVNDWKGILLNVSSSAIINHAVIEYANDSIYGSGSLFVTDSIVQHNQTGINLDYGLVELRDSEFSNNSSGVRLTHPAGGFFENSIFDKNETGIELADTLSTFSVSANQITDNSSVGIVLNGNSGPNLSIYTNTITGNQTGVRLSTSKNTASSPAILDHNTISDNSIGIEIVYAKQSRINPTIRANSIRDNYLYNIKLDRKDTNQSGSSIDAQLNWWGTSDTSIIDSLIHDQNDSELEALVRYAGLLNAEPLPEDVNKKIPKAEFSYLPSAPTALTLVNLDASTSTDSDGGIVGYRWYFGGNTTSTGVATSKFVTKKGSLEVRLEVIDNDGLTGYKEKSIPVSATDSGLNISTYITPLIGHALQPVTFDAAGSSSESGEITSYLWSFGDGDTAPGIQTVHAYQSPGEYIAILTVENDQGEAAQRGTIIAVQEVLPPLQAGIAVNTTSGSSPLTIDFDASSTSGGIGTITYRWDFGDGQSNTGLASAHTYVVPGRYFVQLTATDSNGNKDIIVGTITVSSPTPELTVLTPTNGAVIDGNSILISGTMNNIQDMGVTINSNNNLFHALVDRSSIPAKYFYQVPLVKGENIITVRAVTQIGESEEQILSVTRQSTIAPDFSVSIANPGVILPDTISTSINNLGDRKVLATSYYGIDANHDGIDELVEVFTTAMLEQLNDGEVTFGYNISTPGVYNLHIVIEDDLFQQHQFTLPFEIVEVSELDELIKSKWNNMNQALINGDDQLALSFFEDSAKEKYRPVLQALLPYYQQIFDSYTSIQLVRASNTLVELALNRTIESENYIFFLTYIKDTNGLWKLVSL